MFVTIALFCGVSGAVVFFWNRYFRPVPWRVAGVLWLFCAAYQASTLLTPNVDLPANLAFVAYPWKATGAQPVKANTGIVFTQIAPWTRVAREVLRDGELPLWNRMSGGGAPLSANQQTAIFHPFTLLGLFLPLGKAFTLTSCLRLFAVALFTFVLLRNWDIGAGAAIFGAVAYTFCSFHVVWLLFPLGLATMMLPLSLVGVQEIVHQARTRSYAVLVVGLSLSVLGGHPESALWVWIVTMLFAVYACAAADATLLARVRVLAIIASAFVLAMVLTAFFWYPTFHVLPVTGRYVGMESRASNPANHGLSAEWLLPLVAPNILGTPVNGSYAPPRGSHPAVLNDYGEVASGYAGLATLGLALAAPFVARRKPLGVAAALMICSCLTFAEAPGWRELIRAIPLAGISIYQRLRIFWDLGACIAAAMTLDAAARGERRRATAMMLVVAMATFVGMYAMRAPTLSHDAVGAMQLLTPLVTTSLILMAFRWRRFVSIAATCLVFADLAIATYRYNPVSRPADVYPVTGSIAMLQRAEKPFRFVALGWSFLPDTPSFYGIEDIKTTDPVAHARYTRLMRGYLGVDPSSYDEVVRDTSQPFFDFLNVKYIYAPPGETVLDPKFVARYQGRDGTVLENTHVLPRYFIVRKFTVEPDFDRTVWLSKQIHDFRSEALVDHVPQRIIHSVVSLRGPVVTTRGGQVAVHHYGHGSTVLHVESDGWNLLVSSEVGWPGWRAYWNGVRQPPVVVNGAFLGCFVPPGKGRLELRYVPDEFTKGMRVSGAGLLLLILVAGVRGVFMHRRSRRE